MYSLGIDAADKRMQVTGLVFCRNELSRVVLHQDCDDEEDGAINMTSLPQMNGTLQRHHHLIDFIIQDHKSSVAEHMQHDVEPVFSFATVTVKHNLNERQQDASRAYCHHQF